MYIKRLSKNFSLLDNMLVAHKGIYGTQIFRDDIAPNTFESCKMAIDNGIPFECDVRNTKDNCAVLAHDNYVEYEGSKIKINKYTYQDLVDMLGDDAPTRLEDVLKYNNGKVPIIVDAKEAHIFYSKYRDNIAIALNYYARKGEILLQSFNPFFMLSMREHLEGVLTGQLICRGKTLLDSFRAPKSVAYLYERIISLVCFIARTDVIVMENHTDEKWHKRARLFISEKESKRVMTAKEKLQENLAKSRRFFSSLADKIQLKLVKFAHDLTNKPVMAFTIHDESEFNSMENLYIRTYIVDYSEKGTKEYISKIKKYQGKSKIK